MVKGGERENKEMAREEKKKDEVEDKERKSRTRYVIDPREERISGRSPL